MTLTAFALLIYLAVGLVYACLGPTQIREFRRCYARFSEHGLIARVGLGLFSVLFWFPMLLVVLSYRLAWARRWSDAALIRRNYPARVAALRDAAGGVRQAVDDLAAADPRETKLRLEREALLAAARLAMADRFCDLLDNRCPGCEGRVMGVSKEDRIGAVCAACAKFTPVDELDTITERSRNSKPSEEDIFA